MLTMRLQSICLVVLIVCLGVITRAEGKKNKTANVLTGKDLIDDLEKQMKVIKTLIKPTYATNELDFISGQWGIFLKRLASIENHKSVPRKYIFNIMELHLIMLRTVKPNIVQLYNNDKIEKLFKHFADIYKATKAQIETTRDARHQFEETMRKKIGSINLDMKDPKKKGSISNMYARVFNEMTTFLQVDNLSVKTAIEILDMDEAVLRAEPPILTPQILVVRNHEKIDAEVGKIINRLHEDKRHEKAQRYISGHYDGLHRALSLARAITPKEQKQLINLWVDAMKRHIFYTKYVPSYKMIADNQMIFHIIRKLIPNLEFLHSDPDVAKIYREMTPSFATFEKTYNENVTLMQHLEEYLASSPKEHSVDHTKEHSGEHPARNPEEHAKKWLHFCGTLAVDDLAHRLSSIYVFEVLRADLEFVTNEHIVSEKWKAERTKQLPAIRHAANSMFILNKHNEAKLYEPFERALKAFDEHLNNNKLKEIDTALIGEDVDKMVGDLNKIWPYVDLILTHYAPYLSDFDGTISTQLAILLMYEKVSKWKFHDVTHFKAVIKEMTLNSEIYIKIDDLQTESDEIEDKEEYEEEAEEEKKHPKDAKGHAHDHEHHHHHHELHGPSQHSHKDHPHVEDSKHQMCVDLITTYKIILKNRRQQDIHLARQWRGLVHKYEHEIAEHKVCKFGTKQMEVVKAFHHEIMH